MNTRTLIYAATATLLTAGLAYAGDSSVKTPDRLPAVQREAAGAIAPMFTPTAKLPAVQRAAAEVTRKNGIVAPMFTPKPQRAR
jgi:hypothetical protein